MFSIGPLICPLQSGPSPATVAASFQVAKHTFCLSLPLQFSSVSRLVDLYSSFPGVPWLGQCEGYGHLVVHTQYIPCPALRRCPPNFCGSSLPDSFRIRLPSTRIRRIRQRIRKRRNPLSRVEKKLIRNESDNAWTGESGYFRIR